SLETSDDADEQRLDVCEGGAPRHLAPVVLQLRAWVGAWLDGRLSEADLKEGLGRFIHHAREHAQAAAVLSADPGAAGLHLFEQIRAISIESYERFADNIETLQDALQSGDESAQHEAFRHIEEAAHTLHVLESAVTT
ncbi:MAG: hypothetical protein ACYCW6_17055, partial [Candidatus Xenobia bacterium]